MNKITRIPRKKCIIGKKVGLLTVLSMTENRSKSGAILYDCVCGCGNHRLVSRDSLQKAIVTRCESCAQKFRSDNLLKYRDVEKINLELVEGTNLSIITPQRINHNNTSGYKGVVYDKIRNMWRAQLVFKGKCHNLGRFEDIVDAVIARKKAEEEYFSPILRKYEANKTTLKQKNNNHK